MFWIVGLSWDGVRYAAGCEETLEAAVAVVESHADDAILDERPGLCAPKSGRGENPRGYRYLVVEDGSGRPGDVRVARIAHGESVVKFACPECDRWVEALEVRINRVGVHAESTSTVCSSCK